MPCSRARRRKIGCFSATSSSKNALPERQRIRQTLLRVMKNNSQGIPAAGANRADAVAQMGAVITPRAADRTMVDGEDDRVALVRREHFDARLPARLLFGKDELAAGKILPALAQEEGDLKW